jgi:cytidyltransferase-like protein
MQKKNSRTKIVIVSGHFNPLHGGHLDMIEHASQMGDRLIAIVNNDKQQLLKKGKIILPQQNRARLLAALRHVDEVVVAHDEDAAVSRTLRHLAEKYVEDELIFVNGGDRDSKKVIPEANICEEHNITLVFGVGGENKADSSSRINQALGIQ